MSRKKSTIISISLTVFLVSSILFLPAQVSAAVPVADFAGDPLQGAAPLTVDFVNLSTGEPTSFLWSFGDGSTSTVSDPSHTYTEGGNFTVSLTSTNADGSNTETKTSFVSAIRSDFTVSDDRR